MKPFNARQPSLWPWLLLPARTLLFAAWQMLFALGFLLSGSSEAWRASAAWWPFTITLTNIVCIVTLIQLYRREGRRYWDLFRIQGEHVKRDLVTMLGVLIITGPVAFLPNILGAAWLFDDPQRATALLFPPLPRGAVWAAALLFPVTQGLAEIPTYMAYAMPRLQAQTGRRWLSMILPALFLGVQHITAPLIFDGPFIIWRLIMYLPFALLIALIMDWRPRLLPYLATMHVLLDIAAVMMFFNT